MLCIGIKKFSTHYKFFSPGTAKSKEIPGKFIFKPVRYRVPVLLSEEDDVVSRKSCYHAPVVCGCSIALE